METLENKVTVEKINELVNEAFGKGTKGTYFHKPSHEQGRYKFSEINQLCHLGKETIFLGMHISGNVYGVFESRKYSESPDGSELSIRQSYIKEAEKYAELYEEKYGKPVKIKIIGENRISTYFEKIIGEQFNRVELVNRLVAKSFGLGFRGNLWWTHFEKQKDGSSVKIYKSDPRFLLDIGRNASLLGGAFNDTWRNYEIVGSFTDEKTGHIDGTALSVHTEYKPQAEKYAKLFKKKIGIDVYIETFDKENYPSLIGSKIFRLTEKK
ncbi:MAG TPA: hypothetical protein VEC16_07210 [Alphaproteobacteria bacterium]|nr:hypothetical protein [Alphaproteobacteria bacterium]